MQRSLYPYPYPYPYPIFFFFFFFKIDKHKTSQTVDGPKIQNAVKDFRKRISGTRMRENAVGLKECSRSVSQVAITVASGSLMPLLHRQRRQLWHLTIDTRRYIQCEPAPRLDFFKACEWKLCTCQ